MTCRDINHILARFDRQKAAVFDANYADMLYNEYMSHRIQDEVDREKLRNELKGKEILVIAPGSSIVTYEEQIQHFISTRKPIVIAVNFLPEMYTTDYLFFSNNKRISKIDNIPCKVIITSNLQDSKADYKFDYNSLSGAFDQGCNIFIMLLKLLKDMEIGKAILAGADGYKAEGENYYSSSIRSYTTQGNKFNRAVTDAIRNTGVSVAFLTPSAYDGLG